MTIIVSGLERSGTSLMMQILEDSGFDVCYDDQRKPNIHNPKGYYELDDGKIILELMNKDFDINKYKDKVIKITSYGIPMIDGKNYRVILMKRDMEEVIESQHKMMKNTYKLNISFEDEIKLLEKVDKEAINYLCDNDIDYMTVNYNMLIDKPRMELGTVSKFLGKDIRKSYKVIDKSLYRNRRK